MNEQENLLMASEDKDARSASPSRTDTSAGARGGVINKIGNLLNRAPSIFAAFTALVNPARVLTDQQKNPGPTEPGPTEPVSKSLEQTPVPRAL